MSKTIYLHVGSHKTATTHLQRLLSNNRAALNAQGFDYPEIGKEIFGHHGIMRALKSNDAEVLEGLKAAFAGLDGKVILSSENFEWLSGDEVTKFQDILGPAEFHIIYTFRGWNGLIPSMWQEEIKHGQFMSLSEYCLDHLAFPFKSDLLNYGKVLDKYSAVFPDAKISSISYETAENYGISNLILREIGVADTQSLKDASGRINRSFEPHFTELVRTVNKLSAQAGGRPGYAIRDFLIQERSKPDFDEALLANSLTPFEQATPAFNTSFSFRAIFQSFIENYQHTFIQPVDSVIDRLTRDQPKHRFIGGLPLVDEQFMAYARHLWFEFQQRDSAP